MVLLSKSGKEAVIPEDSRPISVISPFRKLCELTWLDNCKSEVWNTIDPY